MTSSPEFQFRRNSLLVILACVLIASIVTLGFSNRWLFSPSDQGALAFIVVKNAVLFTWLWFRPRALAVVGVAELLFEGVGGVARLGETLLVRGGGGAAGLDGYAFWLALNYFVAALVFRRSVALGVSLGWFALLLAVGAGFWFSAAIPAFIKEEHGNALMQMYLTHATFIAFLYLQGGLLRQYLYAIVRAERAARLAHVDGLTGLANRRQLETWLHAQHERAARTGEPWSVILFDLDHFKEVNDTHGHAVGDQVLQAVASISRQTVREEDLLGRWGGEEFLVILPNTDRTSAGAVATRLQVAVAGSRHPTAGHVTTSCGVAQARPAETVEAALERADEALYAAKRQGRARVKLAH